MGFVAPANTSPQIVAKFQGILAQILQKYPDLKQRFLPLGQELTSTPPAEFANFLKDERRRWGLAVRAANIPAD
jgi:tripartite-type tricarboxylate transporter receptor subunit TctC